MFKTFRNIVLFVSLNRSPMIVIYSLCNFIYALFFLTLLYNDVFVSLMCSVQHFARWKQVLCLSLSLFLHFLLFWIIRSFLLSFVYFALMDIFFIYCLLSLYHSVMTSFSLLKAYPKSGEGHLHWPSVRLFENFEFFNKGGKVVVFVTYGAHF